MLSCMTFVFVSLLELACVGYLSRKDGEQQRTAGKSNNNFICCQIILLMFYQFNHFSEPLSSAPQSSNNVGYQNEFYQSDTDDLHLSTTPPVPQKQNVIPKAPVANITSVPPHYSTLIHR